MGLPSNRKCLINTSVPQPRKIQLEEVLSIEKEILETATDNSRGVDMKRK